MPSPLHTAIALTVGAASLAGCSAASTSTASSSDAPGTLTLTAAFYPLQYVAEQVAGGNATVTGLAQPGVEPHDLELSPSAVRELANADLVLYLADFQPAVDDAIASVDAHGFDAATAVTLAPVHEEHHEEHAEHDDHTEDEHDHDHGQLDPHFWLDPSLLATYATAVGAQLADLDPSNSDEYTENAATLAATLTSLDEAFASGLAQCDREMIVTSHDAFGYLAARYGLEQVGIAGIDPATEPSPAHLLDIRHLVEESGTTTVFTESLVNPAVANAIAQDTGASTAVLSPVESVSDGDDYVSVMTSNLENLKTGLGCA